MKWWLFVVLGLVPFASVAQEAPTLHEVGPGGVTHGAASITGFERRIEADAADYITRYPQGSADRFAEFDATMPLDTSEYEAMGKYAVLLVAVFSQKAEELPLRSLRADNLELRRVGQIARTVAGGSAAGRFFGVNRIDAFYIVPVAVLKRGATLKADFALNRSDFTVGELSAPDAPDFIVADRNDAPTHIPMATALKSMVEREYPSFGIEVAP